MNKLKKITEKYHIDIRSILKEFNLSNHEYYDILNNGVKDENIAKQINIEISKIAGDLLSAEMPFDIMEEMKTRKQALTWWGYLDKESKKKLVKKHFPKENWFRLSRPNIEVIYLKVK